MAADEERVFVPERDASLDEEEEELLLLRNKSTQSKPTKKTVVLVLIILALAVLAILLVVSIAAALIATLGAGAPASVGVYHPKFSLGDVFNSSFSPHLFSGQWYQVGDTEVLATISSHGVVAIFPQNRSNVTLVPEDVMRGLKVSTFVLSPTLKYVLLKGPSTRVYRHSTLASYYVYDIDMEDYVEIEVDNEDTELQFVHWSPVGDQLVLAANYSLFYIANVSTMAVMPVAGVGEKDEEQYGVPDWVYEEEMLSTDHAVWWSPDGANLLYVQFEDVRVPRYKFPIYGPEQDSYTEIESIAYPKSGQRNPNITVYAKALTSASKHTLLPPKSLSGDYYIQTGGWINSSHLYIVWLNRTQNERIFAVYDLSQSENEPLREYTETVEQGWIENDNNPIVVGSSSKLLQIMSREMGQDGGYQHIAEIDMESGSRRFLTSGKWEVTSIVGYKGDTSDVVYVSTESNVWERNVYSSKDGIPKSCLSCSFSDWGNDRGVPSEISTKCTVFTVDCSHSLAYCVLSCQGPAVPFSLLVRYDNGQLVEVLTLESNEMLIEAAHDRFLPKEKKIIVVPADDEQGQPELYGSVLYPPGFDPSKRNHYPVLVSVYGGPGSETILMTNVFYNKWALYQSAERDCIIVSVDGRGTGYRGDKFKFSVYRHLGEFETEDQIRAGRYLSNLNYVNGNRLAIYGTSYGGYMAGMVGSSGSGVFKVAISRSPVTDWRYYDSIYTERYMGTPEDNFDEYERSSLVNRASMLGDISFLLIHGTGDDNVHFQNTAQLVKALTESEVQFRLQFYTDKAHSISGLSAREHLYTLIDSFLRENL